MEEQVLKAADNATKANELLAQATAEPEEIAPAKIVSPTDIVVELPGGLVVAGEVIKTAEVRELNGRDEEAIVRAGSSARSFTTILNRATTLLGDKKATEEDLDRLLIGDRDALLLGIYRATFGNEAELGAYCNGCKDLKTVMVDVEKDIKSKVLVDPIHDTTFTVQGKSHEFLVTLPTGVTQKKLMANPDLNMAESLTILLEQTVLEIDGRPVFGRAQVQNLGLVDRRIISDAIADRNPGPLFEDIVITCPDCESEVQVPISLGALFRL